MSFPSELTLPHLPPLLARADQLAAGEVVDLSGVQRADSAGLAFLIELARRARRRGGSLRFQGAAPQVRALVEFFELESALDFA